MYAIISDIHSNLPALKAVLADIDAEGAEEVICLGDVVGYGPDPLECLELVKERASVTLLGNHDEALLAEPFNFSRHAAKVIEWTKEQLPHGEERTQPLWDFVGDMQMLWERGRDMYVHGSPLDPTQDYLLPSGAGEYEDVFEEFERLLFCGHTHLPCVITPDGRCERSRELEDEYLLDDAKAIVNVGSVGQPRDRDTRACYVLVDDDHVRWRRVEYDVAATVARIRELGLPGPLADRLEVGK